jgi:hypothetical protein
VNDFDVSSCASSLIGPTDFMLIFSKLSTTPLLNGYSGPMNAKSMALTSANVLIDSKSS